MVDTEFTIDSNIMFKGPRVLIPQLIETLKNSYVYAMVKKSPPRVTIHPWEEPDTNWQRIHIDYAAPYHGHYFLIIVDAKSSYSTIQTLTNVFVRNGYPDVMVLDNAAIFKSDKFQTFCTNSGIFQKCIAEKMFRSYVRRSKSYVAEGKRYFV